MDPWGLSFGYRVLALVVFFAVVSVVEVAARGRRAVRWRGSLFALAVGAVGAAVGLAVDSVTSSISPEYFALGKGLGSGPGFDARVRELGIRAGTGAGVVLGCVFVWATYTGRSRHGSLAFAARQLVWPLGWALVLAVALGEAFPRMLSPDVSSLHGGALTSSEAIAFLTVWGVHGGLYLGGVIGLAVGAVRILRERRVEDRPSA